jgi:hypothetical protein
VTNYTSRMCTPSSKVAAGGATRVLGTRTEKPALLKEAFVDIRLSAGDDGDRLPHVGLADSAFQGVCAKGMRFLIGCSSSYAWDSLDRVQDPNFGKQMNPRRSEKREQVVSWVLKARDLHLVMPTKDETILPWKRANQTHAAFVECTHST